VAALTHTLKISLIIVEVLHLLRPGRGVEYCDRHVCLCVCLSVCEHISGTTGHIYTIFCADPCGHDSIAICCVLPVLWM